MIIEKKNQTHTHTRTRTHTHTHTHTHRCVCRSFSQEILQAGAVKGLMKASIPTDNYRIVWGASDK